MFDGEFGVSDVCGNDVYCTGRSSWIRIALRLGILYAFVAYCCWEEIRYHHGSVELPAKVEWVRNRPNKMKTGLQVRYTFRDPDTGIRRLNTVVIPKNKRPSGETATIQFLSGDFPQSRLAVQARPYMVSVFLWTNIGILAVVLGYVGYFAWEANHKPLGNLTPQQRGIERFKRRRNLEREWRPWR